MGVPVTSYDDFQHKLQELLPQSDLFGFVLFDGRPTQRGVGTFVVENTNWLSDIATAADIFLFMPVAPEGSAAASNPSLQVAALFGVAPGELPGVLIFTSDLDGQGVYFPLDAKLFTTDIEHVEDLLASIAEAVPKCRAKSPSKEAILACLQECVNHMKVAEHRKVLVDYARDAAKAVLTFPHEFIKALAEAVAKGMVGA